MSDIKDAGLAPAGRDKINWAKANMPILKKIEGDMAGTLSGLKIAVSVHVEAKTACLAMLLKNAGAKVAVTGCNPLSTQDDVAAALAGSGVLVFAKRGVSEAEYKAHLCAALDTAPNIIIDDGGDLVSLLHGEKKHLIKELIGGSEETTTGIKRLKAREKAGELLFPMIAANDARCKYLFDNRYGTGQSVWDGINRTTNLIVAGKTVVIAGYGWCGKGCAMRAKGQGARVIICEVDPIKAIEAVMDGFSVMPMDDAAPLGDIFITVTGCEDVITPPHFEKMKSGAVLANAGHFDVEISVSGLKKAARRVRRVRGGITEYLLPEDRKIYLLAEGRLVNLAAGDGHPAEIMDMSFAVQALCAGHLAKNRGGLSNKIYPVPAEIDEYIANLKLAAWGIGIDKLTNEQKKYLKSWE